MTGSLIELSAGQLNSRKYACRLFVVGHRVHNPVHCSVDCEEENVRKLVHNAASNVSAPIREREGRAMY